MKIQKAVPGQLSEIMTLYSGARMFMKQHGNPHQWGDSHPRESVISNDITSGNSYVCTENGNILAVFFYKAGNDPSYKNIYQGNWLRPDPYGVIHRLASSGVKKGSASFCLSWAFEQCGNLRIDTHRDNYVMQRLLMKNGFSYCGIIYLEDGSERLAYQKTI
ncbi:GNAT family N-acetyltransferase [Anaerostipes sp.]|uniref:GNAT family N-acetyltransferase n=1 Tax=Anaerostipes sp. TaxID=1872530 RepID=UPI0025C1AD2E|nr:GNAT family N-acetyltransferase [Anaerostipes sp.]MBS7007895.1 GNAT family N-acetyltransferase [Anaerostipes sp.]